MATFDRRDFLAACAASTLGPQLTFAADKQREVPWLTEVQTAPKQLPLGVAHLRVTDRNGEPITTIEQWQRERDSVRQWWLDFLGPMPAKRDHVPMLEVIEEDRDAGVLRQRIRYEVEPGITTEAYLLQPLQPQAKCPGVAVFHSTVDHSIRQPAGVEGKPEKAFGLKLAQRGCVTISPRNYLWPTNDKISAQPEADRFHQRHPKSTGMSRMLHDSSVAVDILCSLPYVDTSRIGSIGHSLGAKEVLYLAAFDERVKVTISSEGGVGTKFSNWNADWYLGKGIDSPDFTREQHELLALAAPRPFLLLGGDSADGDRSWPFIEAALPIYKLYGEPARLGLFNHQQGHAVPPLAEERIYEWFDTYL
ncbi:MAG: dienelactone hydrolase family protein [Planctomycetota bacterium]|nr:dienelactone hydrolase family protein [Planctomycetota bacterium]